MTLLATAAGGSSVFSLCSIRVLSHFFFFLKAMLSMTALCVGEVGIGKKFITTSWKYPEQLQADRKKKPPN